MSTLLELTMIPLDKGDSFSKYVAATLEIIAQSGLNYTLGPMGTVIEGEWDEVMALVTRCFKSLEQHSNRISISIKVDHRKGKENRLSGKIESVQNKTEHKFKTGGD